MKKALAIAGTLPLTITPTESFADHLEPKQSEIRPGGNLSHTDLSGRRLSGARMDGADLYGAIVTGMTANDLNGCSEIPEWVCEKNSSNGDHNFIQRFID